MVRRFIVALGRAVRDATAEVFVGLEVWAFDDQRRVGVSVGWSGAEVYVFSPTPIVGVGLLLDGPHTTAQLWFGPWYCLISLNARWPLRPKVCSLIGPGTGFLRRKKRKAKRRS